MAYPTSPRRGHAGREERFHPYHVTENIRSNTQPPLISSTPASRTTFWREQFDFEDDEGMFAMDPDPPAYSVSDPFIPGRTPLITQSGDTLSRSGASHQWHPDSVANIPSRVPIQLPIRSGPIAGLSANTPQRFPVRTAAQKNHFTFLQEADSSTEDEGIYTPQDSAAPSTAGSTCGEDRSPTPTRHDCDVATIERSIDFFRDPALQCYRFPRCPNNDTERVLFQNTVYTIHEAIGRLRPFAAIDPDWNHFIECASLLSLSNERDLQFQWDTQRHQSSERRRLRPDIEGRHARWKGEDIVKWNADITKLVDAAIRNGSHLGGIYVDEEQKIKATRLEKYGPEEALDDDQTIVAQNTRRYQDEPEPELEPDSDRNHDGFNESDIPFDLSQLEPFDAEAILNPMMEGETDLEYITRIDGLVARRLNDQRL